MWQRVNLPKKKSLTREQLERRQAQAIRFARDVLDDPDLADELADLSVEAYAERRGIQIQNPHERGGGAAMPSKRELVEERDTLLAELEDIRDAIDDVLDEYEREQGDGEGEREAGKED